MAGRGPDERWGRGAAWIGAKGKVVRRVSRTSGPGGETPQGERREARVPVIRHAAPPPRCPRYEALNGAPLPPWREEGNEGGAPRLTTSGADEPRLYESTMWSCLKLHLRNDIASVQRPPLQV